MNEGWICSRCKKVNAPDVKQCDCKQENDDFEELKKYLGKPEPVPQYYPDWTYRPYPYWPYYPCYPWYYYITTTTTAGQANT
jgi:hypothetical protein